MTIAKNILKQLGEEELFELLAQRIAERDIDFEAAAFNKIIVYLPARRERIEEDIEAARKED